MKRTLAWSGFTMRTLTAETLTTIGLVRGVSVVSIYLYIINNRLVIIVTRYILTTN